MSRLLPGSGRATHYCEFPHGISPSRTSRLHGRPADARRRAGRSHRPRHRDPDPRDPRRAGGFLAWHTPGGGPRTALRRGGVLRRGRGHRLHPQRGTGARRDHPVRCGRPLRHAHHRPPARGSRTLQGNGHHRVVELDGGLRHGAGVGRVGRVLCPGGLDLRRCDQRQQYDCPSRERLQSLRGPSAVDVLGSLRHAWDHALHVRERPGLRRW